MKGLGWRKQLPDQRDHLYAAPLAKIGPLPTSVDLRAECPPVYDQGELGSCVANATAAAFQFARMKEMKADDWVPSRLFIYFNARVIEGTVDSDAGAEIRDGIKTVAAQGDAPETEWPYNISKFTETPPATVYADAKKYEVVQYKAVAQTLTQMKGCLAEGFPFAAGFTVYDSFESDEVAQSGVVQMPGSNEQAIGGHAILVVGYTDADSRFIIRNSWGSGWGLEGYFTMPYAYLLDSNLASDFWTIRVVE